MKIVELYGSRSCPYTGELREDLQWRQIDFVEYDVDDDRAARQRLFALTGQGMIPVLVEDGLVTEVGWRGRACSVGAPSL